MNSSADLAANKSLNLTIPGTFLIQEHQCAPDSGQVKVIKTMAYLVLLVFSLVGNLLVVIVISKNRKLQTTVNLLTLNMAVSDLLIPLCAHTLRIKQIHFQLGLWPIGGTLGAITCKLRPFAEGVSLAVSVLTMVIIAIERFFSVVYPMKRLRYNQKNACLLVILATWFIGSLYPGIHFYKSKIISLNSKTYCIWTWQPAFDNAQAIKIEFTIFLVCFTMLPFLLLSSLYSAIVISLCCNGTQRNLSAQERLRRSKENRQVTLMLVSVVIAFFVTRTPLNVFGFLSAFSWSSPWGCDSRSNRFVTLFFAYSYPAINPLIYYTFNENYRKGFRELCSCFTHIRVFCKNDRAHETEGNINYAVDSLPTGVVILAMRRLEVP